MQVYAGGMMTLQELLDNHGVRRDAVWHLEDPEIPDEAFAADVGLELSVPNCTLFGAWRL